MKTSVATNYLLPLMDLIFGAEKNSEEKKEGEILEESEPKS